MLNKNQFEVLYSLYKVSGQSQRELSTDTGLSIGTVNATLKSLMTAGWLLDGIASESGIMELEKHKVDNAIIMAAGLSSRFVPLSFEMPKGLLKVKGEVLIERQIRQLKESGIQDIIVVVGYMKEKFFYLEDQYDVRIVINSEYNRRNNNSTLHAVKDLMGNSYICSSDNYFTENVFEPFVYDSYYSCIYEKEKTNEYYLTVGSNQKITQVRVGGEDGWIMLGHVYFSKEFSSKFLSVLEAEYDEPGVDKMLWEDLYIKHIKTLDIYAQKYNPGIIMEFDSLEDLKKFDSAYINNANSTILSNICSVFNCIEKDVKDIVLLNKGFLNSSFVFTYLGMQYVYSLPGTGTSKIINMANQSYAEECARELGLNGTLVIVHKSGWKISKFIEPAIDFDYTDESHVRNALRQISRLHEAHPDTECTFDYYTVSRGISTIMIESGNMTLNTFDNLTSKIEKLHSLAENDGIEKCLCHNSCFGFNFNLDSKQTRLANWEYSSKSDPGNDLGTFICGSDYSLEEVNNVFEIYFKRPLTAVETRHYLAYVAISAYFWLSWGVYRETFGEDLGKYIYKWYKLVDEYSDIAIHLYL